MFPYKNILRLVRRGARAVHHVRSIGCRTRARWAATNWQSGEWRPEAISRPTPELDDRSGRHLHPRGAAHRPRRPRGTAEAALPPAVLFRGLLAFPRLPRTARSMARVTPMPSPSRGTSRGRSEGAVQGKVMPSGTRGCLMDHPRRQGVSSRGSGPLPSVTT
jgi:hypothetical protein